MALSAGFTVRALAYDLAVDSSRDLTCVGLARELRELCSSGGVAGFFAGPPCSTVSRARHRLLAG
eukprot:6671341-Pyramimonas_sp.AAC.1